MNEKPSVDELRKTFDNFPPWITTEGGLDSPLGRVFVQQYLAMPDEPDKPRQLRSSRFSMQEYVT